MPKLIYSPEDKVRIKDHVCAEIENLRSLSEICAKDKGMPAASMIVAWRYEDPEFAERFARAREAQIEKLLEETLDIAEEATDDAYIWTDPKTKRQFARIDGSTIKRAALRIQTRENFAKMMCPERFAQQRMDVTSGGKALPSSNNTRDNRLDAILMLALARRSGQQPAGPMIDITPEPSLDEIMKG